MIKEKSIITETFYPDFITIYHVNVKKSFILSKIFLIFHYYYNINNNNNLIQLINVYFKVEYIDFENIFNKFKNILPHRKI